MTIHVQTWSEGLDVLVDSLEAQEHHLAKAEALARLNNWQILDLEMALVSYLSKMVT